MAFKTDTWKLNSPNATTDWGTSAANWSTGFPGSNNDVVINTAAVQTVIYSSIDNATVHSLTVGNDTFEMSGGTLVITAAASFANNFQQTGGILSAGGKVTLGGIASLTGGIAEGGTAFIVNGTVTLANNYELTGGASLTNKNTTNQTSQITVNSFGVKAAIDNAAHATYAITGDFGISGGLSGALFVNAGTLKKTGGSSTSFIAVDVTDTGIIDVAIAGTIEFGGLQNSFAGAISGAGQVFLGNGSNDAINRGTTITTAAFTISDSRTVATLNENLAFANSFSLENSATLDLASVTLTLSGVNQFINSATLGGSGTLVTKKSSNTTVSSFFVGGGVTWQNFGTVGGANFLQLGDASFNKATFFNEKGGIYQFTQDVNIQGGPASNGSFVNAAGATLEKTGGTNTSFITVDVTDAGSISVQTGAIEFQGIHNNFGGTISGPGTFWIGGGFNTIQAGTKISTSAFDIINNVGTGTIVVLGGNLSYVGALNFENSADLNLGGFTLTLSGSDTFSNSASFDGTGTLVTAKNSTIALSSNVVLGGAIAWENSGNISELSGNFEIGDNSNDAAKFINETTGVLNFTTDNGITLGAVPTSSFTNFGTVEKTGGTGDSGISSIFTNNGKVVVGSGEIEFGNRVSGNGSFTIDAGTVLRFDSTVAKGSTVVFASKTSGDLQLFDSPGFGAGIKGFGGTDEIELRDISGTVSLLYKKLSASEGVLTVSNGSQTAKLTFFGSFSSNSFHASADPFGGTLIQDPGPHPLLASAR